MAKNGNTGSTSSLMGATYRYTLTGVSPLLMHFDNIEEGDRVKAEGRGEDSVAGDDRHPADTWKTYLYHDGTNIGIPFNNIMAAIGYVGGKIKMPRPINSLKIISQTGIILGEPYAKLTTGGKQIDIERANAVSGPFVDHAKQVAKLGFGLDVRGVSVNGKRHIRVRPRFDPWLVDGTFTINDEVLTEALLNKLFDMAGRMSGLGDWRPGCSGRQKKPGVYGRFSVELKRVE